MPDRAAIKSLIEQRLVLPPKTQRGHVYVQFVVSKKGVVSHPRIVKGLRAAVDSAVVAAVRRLPDLAPGTQYGQPVNVSLTLSVDVGKEQQQ
jgi:protein TonB